MDNRPLTLEEKQISERRRKQAANLLEIAGNPMTDEDHAFTAKMDELGLIGEDRADYLRAHHMKHYGGK